MIFKHAKIAQLAMLCYDTTHVESDHVFEFLVQPFTHHLLNFALIH